MLMVMILGFAISSCWAKEGYDDLAKLVKSGVGDEIVLAYINASDVNYALTPDEIIQLKTNGASSKVITAAIQHKKPVSYAAAQKSVAATVPSNEPAAAMPPAPAVSGNADPGSVYYEDEPASGTWVLVDNYWYWQYPTGVIVDMGWQPYYFYHNHWLPYRHGGHGRRGW